MMLQLPVVRRKLILLNVRNFSDKKSTLDVFILLGIQTGWPDDEFDQLD
jgi:hypothetical protein